MTHAAGLSCLSGARESMMRGRSQIKTVGAPAPSPFLHSRSTTLQRRRDGKQGMNQWAKTADSAHQHPRTPDKPKLRKQMRKRKIRRWEKWDGSAPCRPGGCGSGVVRGRDEAAHRQVGRGADCSRLMWEWGDMQRAAARCGRARRAQGAACARQAGLCIGSRWQCLASRERAGTRHRGSCVLATGWRLGPACAAGDRRRADPTTPCKSQAPGSRAQNSGGCRGAPRQAAAPKQISRSHHHHLVHPLSCCTLQPGQTAAGTHLAGELLLRLGVGILLAKQRPAVVRARHGLDWGKRGWGREGRWRATR